MARLLGRATDLDARRDIILDQSVLGAQDLSVFF